MERLRQIPPETGRFLSILAASSSDGKIIEIGTSAGYSTLYLALAAIETGRKVTTFETLDDKIKIASDTFKLADIENDVELINGDARDYLNDIADIAFCFLDAEKEVYQDCYDLVIPNMITGGIFIADNLISHSKELKPFEKVVMADKRVDSVVVPIGKGELVCRKIKF